MFKKTFLTLLIALAGTLAHANGDAMPQILASLDSDTENQLHMMTDSELSEVKGTGPLPKDFTFKEFHYAWNFYGSDKDYRSYISTGGGTWFGGKRTSPSAETAFIGEAYLVTYDGINAPMSSYETIEEHSLVAAYDAPNNIIYYQWHKNFKDWNRPWNGSFSIGPFTISAL